MLHNEGQHIHTGNLCSIAHAAEMLDLPKSRVQRWADRRKITGFPEPIYSHGHTVVYSFPAIKQWVDIWYRTRRRDG